MERSPPRFGLIHLKGVTYICLVYHYFTEPFLHPCSLLASKDLVPLFFVCVRCFLHSGHFFAYLNVLIQVSGLGGSDHTHTYSEDMPAVESCGCEASSWNGTSSVGTGGSL